MPEMKKKILVFRKNTFATVTQQIDTNKEKSKTKPPTRRGKVSIYPNNNRNKTLVHIEENS